MSTRCSKHSFLSNFSPTLVPDETDYAVVQRIAQCRLLHGVTICLHLLISYDREAHHVWDHNRWRSASITVLWGYGFWYDHFPLYDSANNEKSQLAQSEKKCIHRAARFSTSIPPILSWYQERHVRRCFLREIFFTTGMPPGLLSWNWTTFLRERSVLVARSTLAACSPELLTVMQIRKW